MMDITKQKLSREEFVNKFTHFPGVLLGILFLVLLLIKSNTQNTIHSISYAVYAISYILVFGASTIYHAQICDKRKSFFKKIAHASIYIFMAGCYTPLVLINMEESVRYPFLILVWVIATFGVLYKLFSKYKNRVQSTLLYFLFGYMCYLAKGSLLDQLPPASYDLLVYGGIVYSIGAIFYMLKFIPYHHAIWHVFVIGGSSLHFGAIYLTY